MGRNYSVFISAVTREFGAARERVAAALRARNLEVEVQSSFGQGGGTTLAMLHDYIRACNRVIAAIGDYSGAYPPEAAVTDEFRAMLPAGMTRASMTQWEVIFARTHGRELFLFEADGVAPEQVAGEDDDRAAQAAWRHWLFDKGLGLNRRQFHSAEDLRAHVMELDWPNLARPKPNNLPGSIGNLFKGREDFLKALRESFRHNSATAITGKAVHGLGGVGKTRAAIEYGHAFADDYVATLFVAGKSESDLRDSLAALADALVLDLPERDFPDLDARIAAVIRWLLRNPGWLLVIDNVDDELAAGAVRTLLDHVGRGKGHVVITSRVSDWGHVVEALELDLLSIQAATDLLRESTPHRTKVEDEDVLLTRLADEQLGCLSLALVQAAAYIEERRIGFAEYTRLFENEAAALLARLGKAAVRNLGYPLPVALTWQTSIAQLSEEGRFLLDMLSWLSIEPIPRGLFDVWPHAEIIDLSEALAELSRYSFVHWEAENRGITLHRLVAQVTRGNMDQAARDFALTALFPWILIVNPSINAGDVRCWPRLLPLLPHVLLLSERAGASGNYPRQAALYNEYATLLQSLARYSEAEPLFRLALAIDEARFGPSHPEVALRLNNLALLLLLTNRLDEAELFYRRALAIDEASDDPESPAVATALVNLASLLRETERQAEAEDFYRRALAIDEAYYGVDHPEVATDLNNLGSLLQETGRTAEAEQLYLRALAISEVSYGHDHPAVATSLSNLATLLQITHRFEEAEPVSRRALEIYEANYGADHPDVATGLNNLSMLLRATGRAVDAEPVSRRSALILLRQSKASGHWLPNTTAAVQYYANTLIETGSPLDRMVAALTQLMTEAGFDPAEYLPQMFGGEDASNSS